MKKVLLLLMLIAMCLPLMAEQRTASEAQNVASNTCELTPKRWVDALVGVYIVVADGNCFKVVVR